MSLMSQFNMIKLYLRIHEKTLRETLEELLPQAGIFISQEENESTGILFTPPALNSSLPSFNFWSMAKPVRFLDILSALESLPYRQEVMFSHFSLDLRERFLKNIETQHIERLTEKECHLLHFFYQNRGVELSKETLLKEIWEYHPTTETHTLETHIYRLRQKLEEDSNSPQILLNCKEGYWMP